MEFLHPAMWHDHDIDFVRWLHHAMWHAALESWQWIHQVAAPCNVTRSFGIMTLHSPGNSILQCGRWLWDWIRPNVRHIGILYLVSISTTSPQLTCHSAPVSEIFIQIGPPSAEKNDVMSIFKMADLSNLGFQRSNNGFFEKLNYNFLCRHSSMNNIALNCLVFQKRAFLNFGIDIQDDGSPPSWISGVQ